MAVAERTKIPLAPMAIRVLAILAALNARCVRHPVCRAAGAAGLRRRTRSATTSRPPSTSPSACTPPASGPRSFRSRICSTSASASRSTSTMTARGRKGSTAAANGSFCGKILPDGGGDPGRVPVHGTELGSGAYARVSSQFFAAGTGHGAGNSQGGDGCGNALLAWRGVPATGIYVESGAQALPDGRQAFVATAGVSLRLPALAGLLIFFPGCH